MAELQFLGPIDAKGMADKFLEQAGIPDMLMEDEQLQAVKANVEAAAAQLQTQVNKLQEVAKAHSAEQEAKTQEAHESDDQGDLNGVVKGWGAESLPGAEDMQSPEARAAYLRKAAEEIERNGAQRQPTPLGGRRRAGGRAGSGTGRGGTATTTGRGHDGPGGRDKARQGEPPQAGGQAA